MLNESAVKIVEFFDEYKKHFDELRLFIAKKQEKVVGDDIIWMMDSLTEEQRLVMRGNSLESKRLLLFDELGLTNVRSTQLLEMLPEEYKGRFRLAVTSMENSIDYIKSTNEAILDIIERKLTVQAEELNQSIISGSDTYNASGAKIHKTVSSMENDFLGKV